MKFEMVMLWCNSQFFFTRVNGKVFYGLYESFCFCWQRFGKFATEMGLLTCYFLLLVIGLLILVLVCCTEITHTCTPWWFGSLFSRVVKQVKTGQSVQNKWSTNKHIFHYCQQGSFAVIYIPSFMKTLTLMLM
jgi:hypothetical protein